MQRNKASLFAHLAGDGEKHRRDCQADFSCRFQIDDELEPGRLLDRQVGTAKLGTTRGAYCWPSRGGIFRNLSCLAREDDEPFRSHDGSNNGFRFPKPNDGWLDSILRHYWRD
jgi:hypothetical protein